MVPHRLHAGRRSMQRSSLPNDAAAVNKFAVANLFSMAYALMHGQVVLLQ